MPPTPNNAAKAPALLSPPAARAPLTPSMSSPSVPIAFWRDSPAALSSTLAPPLYPIDPVTAQALETRAAEMVPRPMSPTQPIALSPNFIIPVSPVVPIVSTKPETWQEPQANTTYEVGLHVTEYPPHFVERIANTQESEGEGAAHPSLREVALGDELIAINDEDISRVEMRRVPHLVLGVFGSRAKYTLRNLHKTYEVEAERLIPAQMFRMYTRATEAQPRVSASLQQACFELMDDQGKMKDFLTDYLHDETTLGLELAIIGNEFGWEARQVGAIIKGSPADLDGRVQTGDTLLAVDGVAVDGGMAHERIRNRLRVVGSRCVLTLSRVGQTYDVNLPWTSAGMTYIVRDLLHLLLNVRTAIQTEFDRNTMLLWLDKAWAHAIRMQRIRLDSEGFLANRLSKLQVSIFNKVGAAKQEVDQMPQAGFIWEEIDRMASKTAELHNKLSAADKELEELRAYRDRNASLIDEIERLQKENRSLREEMDDAASRHSKNRQELEAEILRLKGIVSPLESELEHLRTEYPKEKDLRAKAETEWQNLIRENAKLLAEAESLIAAETRAREELDDNKEQLREAREEIETHRQNLQGWAVLSPFMAGPPRLSPSQLAEKLNDAGLRSKELVRLCDLLKGPPREDVDHVAKVLEFLHGPPKRTLAQLHDMLHDLEVHREQMRKLDDEISQLKEENMRERRQRLDAEMEIHGARQLTELSTRAWDDYKPMIEYLTGPPAVGPKPMAIAMRNCGSNPDELLELLKAMAGPPPLLASDLLHITKAFAAEKGMSAESVQTLWAKLTSINGARFRKANLPAGAAVDGLLSRRDVDRIGSTASKAPLPEERWLNSVNKNVKEEEKASYLSSYETQRRLKNMLSSHEDYRTEVVRTESAATARLESAAGGRSGAV